MSTQPTSKIVQNAIAAGAKPVTHVGAVQADTASKDAPAVVTKGTNPLFPPLKPIERIPDAEDTDSSKPRAGRPNGSAWG